MTKLKGRVVKGVASRFSVYTDEGVKTCLARGRLKSDGFIYVGDYVEIVRDRDVWVIESVAPRKNALIRPYVSNIDLCLITVAPVPAPDFLLVDKVIVNCLAEGITPVLVVNKSDIEKVDVSEYNCVETVFCSAETEGGADVLVPVIGGKTVCFAGQSAVGKSSLINALIGSPLLEVGALAKKTDRGKHTTRRTELIPLGDNTWVADTCGFSMLEAVELPPAELRLYYDDFEPYRPACRFNGCTHIDEPDCAVRAEVGKSIGKGRYERYKTIFAELDERRKNKYD